MHCQSAKTETKEDSRERRKIRDTRKQRLEDIYKYRLNQHVENRRSLEKQPIALNNPPPALEAREKNHTQERRLFSSKIRRPPYPPRPRVNAWLSQAIGFMEVVRKARAIVAHRKFLTSSIHSGRKKKKRDPGQFRRDQGRGGTVSGKRVVLCVFTAVEGVKAESPPWQRWQPFLPCTRPKARLSSFDASKG
ncbi:hypothetical protein KM043_009579 [Ampulex compressa]|nr:hypothetical protein KM043_009579 [Ampulex compressa]